MSLSSLSSAIPLYLQVEATLKEMIEENEYLPGEQIPSERELSETLGVSRMTIRRAIENLIQHGLLERQSTNGTFVRQPQVFRKVGKDIAMGLTQMLAEEGAISGSVLLAFEEIRAPRKVAEKLEVSLGARLVMICRLRTANGIPFAVETSYLPREIVPNLCREDLEGNNSLYAIIRSRYGVQLIENKETLKLSYATAEEAGRLELREGDPVLLLRSVVLDINNRPIEYLKSVNHPKRVMFQSTSTM